MPDYGHQHHHGVRKNLVEGIGGLIVGAAAVLLLTRLFRKDRTAAAAQPAPKRASRRTKAAR